MSAAAVAKRVVILILCGLFVTWSIPWIPVQTAAGNEPIDDTATTSAERLVADALRAEITGDAARRAELLSKAINAAPDYAPARWQCGQVCDSGQWLPVDQAQQAAAADPKRAEYLRLRAAGGDTLGGQLALARWSRKNGLDDEARFHWASVLARDPNNDDAQHALGVRWFHGRLMTFAEIDTAKERAREFRAAAKEFAPQVARWERLLSAGDLNSRDLALGEIRALHDPGSIPALEDVTLDSHLATNAEFERTMQMGLALIEALDQMPGQPATNSLIRHAVTAPVRSVRVAAIAALKKRPPHDYLPLLLAALSMPIESSFRVATDADGSVHYWCSLYREGPDADWSFEARRSAMQFDLAGPLDVTIDDRIRKTKSVVRIPAATNPAVTAEMAAVAVQNQRRFGAQAVSAEQQVAAMNRAIEDANRPIYPVLVATTGQEIGENPRAWWDWWNDYNEYSSDGAKPVYERHAEKSTYRYYRPPREGTYVIDPPPPPPRRYSCFAAGTLVQAKTGERAIETLGIGELVLAQDADTGELAYKPIIGRTVRPPSEFLKLSVGGEELQATLGHPLWVDGVGWRMAKQLADGAILHSVNGPVRVDAVAEADEAEAYNLIVADFNTYFVGKSGILVHDNTPREPTTALVPGLAVK
jgi:Pretoxin HINT domain